MSKTQRKQGSDDTVKTSIKLPRKLWRKAHILALDERTQLQKIIEKALEAYVKKEGAK